MKQNRIREVRKEVGMTQEQLAKVLGINRATLSRYESGDIDPPSSQFYRIADALGVHTWELFELGTVDTNIQALGASLLEFMGYRPPDESKDTTATKLWSFFDQLNPDGQQKAVERVEELTEIPRYRADNPSTTD